MYLDNHSFSIFDPNIPFELPSLQLGEGELVCVTDDHLGVLQHVGVANSLQGIISGMDIRAGLLHGRLDDERRRIARRRRRRVVGAAVAALRVDGSDLGVL